MDTVDNPAIPPHLSQRPVVNGLPVPWVVEWTAEQEVELATVRTPDGLWTKGPTVLRDGVTWIDVPDIPEGRPLWRLTHSARQRQCMVVPRCQVCGARIEGRCWFLIPPANAVDFERYGGTLTPPMCSLCAGVAGGICPHLVANPPLVLTGYPKITAVQGDLYETVGDPPRSVVIDPVDPRKRWLIGRQYFVKISSPRPG